MNRLRSAIAVACLLTLAACGDDDDRSGGGDGDGDGDGGGQAGDGDGAGGAPPGPPCATVADCDDGLYCNGAEACVDGRCRAGEDPADDGHDCTADSCDEDSDSVAHAPDDAACDNGLYCDGVETCEPGRGCVSGAAPALDDGIDCTVDSCDEDADAAVHTASDALCDNGVFCDGGGRCEAGGCVEIPAPELDDRLSCTVDSCDEDADQVVHDEAGCGCLDFGLSGFECPTGLSRYCASALSPSSATQAKEACEACYGLECFLEDGDCAGGAYGPSQGGDFEPGDAYFGFEDGCSGSAGRIWRVSTSHVTYGRWAASP